MRFITSVIHHVEDVGAASIFFCSTLGFGVKDQSKDWVIIENGAIEIRLVSDAKKILGSLNLELQTKQHEQDSKELLSQPGVSLIAEKLSDCPSRVENRFQCPHGLVISLIREFNEDELGIIPPLPISLDWDVDAQECIRRIIRVVPISFRQAARTRITEKAEMLTARNGSITVDIDCAVQALAEATPHFQHPALETGLLDLGIDSRGHFVRDPS